MKVSSILGLNSRSALYARRYNTSLAKKIANSKLLTDRVLRREHVPHPKIFVKFKDYNSVVDYDWNALPNSFALKPSRGLGGEGIIVVKKKIKDNVWLTTQKTRITSDDLKLHTLDIIEGAYSMGNDPDVAFVQEYVGRHSAFRKIAYRGTPDIRVIVFNKIPVMAMLRLPTKESGGRANLHQGALGLGIDLATGITTKAIQHGKQIVFKPDTLRKLHGIKIPNWNSILETAVRGQIASGLGYAGVDVVLHPEKGPQIIELNAQPGLQIQLANMDGLRKRLERVDDIEVRDADHGVLIAKALFAGRFADRVKIEEGIKTISVWEDITLRVKGKRITVPAKVDTGAWRTSIDKDLAKKVGLLETKNILWTKKVRTATGKEDRSVINLEYTIAGRRVSTIASISTRSHLRVPIIIGRKDLSGFVINPHFKDKALHWVPEKWQGIE